MQSINKALANSFIILPLIISSCASTQKTKMIEAMLVGTSLGAIYGATRPAYQNQNALLFGSMGGLAGAAVAVVTDDSDKKIKDLESKVKFFDEFTTKNTPNFEEIPEEYKALLESQNYEMYKINRWTKKGQYLVNESSLIELKER